MIGVYDYTVILTYLSLISASVGIVITLIGAGHPCIGIFCLLFCGLCDAFDGKVANTKKNRTKEEKQFGIQIDSLSDLIAFGLLPMCIGVSLLNYSPFMQNLINENLILKWTLYIIFILYVLAALIRLAYFNVTEDARQKKESGVRKVYTGLPVTSSAIIFPTIILFQYLLKVDLSILYYVILLCMSFAFLLKFKLKKLGMKGILTLVFFGIVEFILFIILNNLK